LRIEQGPVAGDAGCEPAPEQMLAKFRQFTGGDPAFAHWARQVQAPGARATHPTKGTAT
jgi:hypothetical protein